MDKTKNKNENTVFVERQVKDWGKFRMTERC